jgi:hypothetical protein
VTCKQFVISSQGRDLLPHAIQAHAIKRE